MSFDMLSGITGTSSASLSWASAAAQGTGTAQIDVTAQAAGAAQSNATQISANSSTAPQSMSASDILKLGQPVMRIPAYPLSPAVLAELIGRQAPL